MEKDKFYRNFFKICIALVLQNVITLSVNLTDNVMIGAYSETALAGVAAVNQIQFIYQQLLLAIGDGLVMFCSQYWGKNETEPMKRITATAMRAAFVIAVVLFLIVSIWPTQVLRIFTPDEPIIAEGMNYLTIVRFTYLFFALTQILLAALRSVETVKIAFYMSIMTFFINCIGNYVFIFGRFGSPALGAAGAAVSTLCARIIECAVIILYAAKKDFKLKLKLSDFRQRDAALGRSYYKTTVPIMVVQGLWGVNTALQTVILGHMTDTAIAANSVASTLYLMVKSMAVGAASAAAVIIGKAIGAGDIGKVKSYAKRLQKLFLLIGAASAVILFFLRIPVLKLYNLQQETMNMADTFLLILCVVCVGVSYQMPTNNGIIRGGGSAKFVVKLDLISIWCIVIPLSFIMAFVVKAPPAVVVCCLNADQLFKCVPAYIKANYGKWIYRLTV